MHHNLLFKASVLMIMMMLSRISYLFFWTWSCWFIISSENELKDKLFRRRNQRLNLFLLIPFILTFCDCGQYSIEVEFLRIVAVFPLFPINKIEEIFHLIFHCLGHVHFWFEIIAAVLLGKWVYFVEEVVLADFMDEFKLLWGDKNGPNIQFFVFFLEFIVGIGFFQILLVFGLVGEDIKDVFALSELKICKFFERNVFYGFEDLFPQQ